MRYLFFDIECADGNRAICEYGYVLTDEKFNVLRKRNILMDPECPFNLTGREGQEDLVLTYPYSEYYKYYPFDDSYETINHDDYDWIVKEYDDYVDKDDFFSDKLNIAIPLGLTYDYKNFSVNATYHLPLTKCYKDKWGGDEYSLKHQAFDLTVGYRLPLRKR